MLGSGWTYEYNKFHNNKRGNTDHSKNKNNQFAYTVYMYNYCYRRSGTLLLFMIK